jgi:hypothetical protein
MSPYTLAIILSVATLALMINLLRTRRMREKYATWWVLLAVAVLLLALTPWSLQWASNLVGIAEPTNLLFFASGFVLLAVCIQFSTELSNLEEDRRVLAEEVAILRLEFDQLSARMDHQPPIGRMIAARATDQPATDPVRTTHSR